MRVLIDECLPRRFAEALVDVEAKTVPEAGWAGRTNGELLALAETEFDVFVTIDQSLVHQQSLEGRRLAVIVIAAASNRFDVLAPLVPEVAKVLQQILPGKLVRITG